MPPRPLSFLNTARDLLLRAEGVPILGRGARAVGRVVAAASMPFSAPIGSQGSPNIPPPNYSTDQPAPPPWPPRFDPKYHGHTFQSFAAPLAFGGWDIERARSAIEQHDLGYFYESSTLAIALTRFPAVYAALGVRCAPLISLPRQVQGGPRGLSKMVAIEIENQLAPRAGLLPSPCFPSTLYGAIAIDLAMMGFAVLQHVYGDPDERGIRRVYTRRWPTWAVWYQRYRKTFQAMTMDGPVDIISGDGKFTLIGKTDEPHFQGAVRSIAMPAIDAAQIMQARAQWIDRFSDPKLVVTMPEKVPVRGPEGDAAYEFANTVRGPGGFGVLPSGAKSEWAGLKSEAGDVYTQSLGTDNGYIDAALTGIDTGADKSVYMPVVYWGILRSTVGDDISATVRGINAGHVAPYLWFNHAEGIERDIARGTWVEPVLSIPLPDPEADARAKSYADRCKAFTDILDARRAAKIQVTQEDADKLADELALPHVVLAGEDATPVARLDLAPTDLAKVVRVDEARASRNLPGIGDERGDLTIAELDAVSKKRAAETPVGALAGGDGGEGQPGTGEPAEGPPEPSEEAA